MIDALSKKLYRQFPREYATWQNMRRRCDTPTNVAYKYYGGRGIRVSPEFDNFQRFLEVLGPRPDGMSLDRIDANGDYSPGNVRWADKQTQARNVRSRKLINHRGESLTLIEWSERTGIPKGTIWRRLYVKHWSPADALDIPVISARRAGLLGAKKRWEVAA